MRNIHRIGLVRLFATGLALAAAASVAWAGPRLKVSQRVWDFGEVWYGDPCVIDIEISNVGDLPLHIGNVKSTCGCTTAKPNKSTLQPGESDSLRITYDTTKYEKDVRQTITLITDDEVEPELKITVRGKVVEVFECEPRRGISFGKAAPESVKTGIVTLISNLPEDVTPSLQPLPEDSPFDVKLETIDAGKKYRLIAATKPPLKVGRNHQFVYINTGVERLPTMKIGVNVQTLDKVTLWPDKLRVIEAQTNRSSRTLHLYYSPEHELQITDVKANFDGVSIKLQGRQKPDSMSEFASIRLSLSLPPFGEFPDKGAKVEIYTDHPDPKYRVLEAPIDKVDRRNKSKP